MCGDVVEEPTIMGFDCWWHHHKIKWCIDNKTVLHVHHSRCNNSWWHDHKTKWCIHILRQMCMYIMLDVMIVTIMLVKWLSVENDDVSWRVMHFVDTYVILKFIYYILWDEQYLVFFIDLCLSIGYKEYLYSLTSMSNL